MTKNIERMTISEGDREYFDVLVNRALNDGWKLDGTCAKDYGQWHQNFIKGDPENVNNPNRTLRQYYAGQSLQGLMINSWGHISCNALDPNDIARACFEIADAMIAHEEAENDGKDQ